MFRLYIVVLAFLLASENSVSQTYSEFDLSTYDQSELKFELKTLKVKKNYQNTLTVTNAESGTILKKITLPVSIKQQGHLAQSENSPFLFFYHSSGKNSGNIQVYSKASLNIMHDIKTDRLTYTRFLLQNHFFFEVGSNPNNLFAFLGSTKNPSLYELSGKTGQLSKKMSFEKNTLLKGHQNMNYLWARRVSGLGRPSAGFNKKNQNKIKFINTENFEVFREISLTQPLISALYWEDVIQLLFDYNNKDSRYRVMLLNLQENTLYDDFYSSSHPDVISVNGPYKSLVFVGESIGSNKHLKIAKFHDGKMTEISNPEINIQYNNIDFKHDETGYKMFVYGKNLFGVIDINNTENYKIIHVPMNVTDGFLNSQASQIFLQEENGPEVALVDIEKSKFVASQKTGSPIKKFGQALASVLTIPLTAPSGYMTTPLGGFRQSDVKLFLNDEGNRLFAINKKTNDVTSFAANDMSDKHIVDTGKGTFQIIQATHEPDLPVVVIGMKKVTFLTPNNGRMIKQIEYDKPLEISNNHVLTYKKDNQSRRISLAYISD